MGRASSAGVPRPLSATKWGSEREGCQWTPGHQRPSSAPGDTYARRPISYESLRALAGLSDELLGILADDSDLDQTTRSFTDNDESADEMPTPKSRANSPASC